MSLRSHSWLLAKHSGSCHCVVLHTRKMCWRGPGGPRSLSPHRGRSGSCRGVRVCTFVCICVLGSRWGCQVASARAEEGCKGH